MDPTSAVTTGGGEGEIRGRTPLAAACAPVLVDKKYCFWSITQRQDNTQ